jgi:plasmid maintenance system killer protein
MDQENERAFNRYFPKNSPPKIYRIALLQLRLLNQARNINDLQNPPSNRYHSNRGAK